VGKRGDPFWNTCTRAHSNLAKPLLVILSLFRITHTTHIICVMHITQLQLSNKKAKKAAVTALQTRSTTDRLSLEHSQQQLRLVLGRQRQHAEAWLMQSWLIQPVRQRTIQSAKHMPCSHNNVDCFTFKISQKVLF